MKKIILSLAVITVLISWTSKPIKWVAIGDSITYLNNHLPETGDRVKKGYMTRVCEELTNVTYVNKGYNGWTTRGIANGIENLGLPNADVYSVFLGTNDWWSGHPIGTIDDYINSTGTTTIYGAYRVIIDKIRQLNASAKIILITPLQRGDFIYIGGFANNAYGSYREKDGQSLSDVAGAIKSIGAYDKISVIDLYNRSGITQQNMVKFKRLKNPDTGEYQNYKYPAYTSIPFNPNKDDYPYPIEAEDMTYDGLHPSDKGNAVIANMIVEVLKKLYRY